MSLGDHLAAVFGRYDGTALRPPVRPAVPVAPAAWAGLQDWCFEGAGPGGSPFLQPGALPAVQTRFAVAHWPGPDSVAQAWALALDGSDQLEARRGRINKLLLRLQTKWDDACWWRERRAHDPWDAGQLIDSDAALHRLQQDFQPRRATLLMAGAMDASSLVAGISALHGRSAGFRHPVRLLCLAAAPMPFLEGVAITRLPMPDHLAL